MSRENRIAVSALVLAAIAGGIVAGVLHASRAHFAIWYPSLFAVAVVAAALAVRRAWRAGTAAPVPAHGRDADPSRPPGMLGGLERRVAAAGRQRASYRRELQPVLVEIARARLARRGRVWDDSARPLLGEEAWRWLTTTVDRGPPPDPATLSRVLGALDQL